VSAVGPSGTGTEIPHVAGIPDDEDAGLPPGERCYSCDVGENGIPLERPLSDSQSRRRYRRRANYTLALPVDRSVELSAFGSTSTSSDTLLHNA